MFTFAYVMMLLVLAVGGSCYGVAYLKSRANKTSVAQELTALIDTILKKGNSDT